MSGTFAIPTPDDLSGEIVHRCATCGSPVLAGSVTCHGCGRSMRALPILALPDAASEKSFYVSSGGCRRVRAMGVLAALLAE